MTRDPDRRGHCVCGHLGWVHHPSTTKCHTCECTTFKRCTCREPKEGKDK